MDSAKTSVVNHFIARRISDYPKHVTQSIREEALNAAFKGETSGLTKFVENGGDLNSKVVTKLHPSGLYLLEAAMFSGSIEAFKWLVEHGAKTEVQKISGKHLLVVAIERLQVDICRFLLGKEKNLAGIRDSFGDDLLGAVSYRTYCDLGKEIQKMIQTALEEEARCKNEKISKRGYSMNDGFHLESPKKPRFEALPRHI